MNKRSIQPGDSVFVERAGYEGRVGRFIGQHRSGKLRVAFDVCGRKTVLWAQPGEVRRASSESGKGAA